jgi:putative spermidine/putrescine transport system permease protein
MEWAHMLEIGKRGRIIAWACAVPFLVIVMLFEITPLLAVMASSIFKSGAVSAMNYWDILSSRFYLNAFKASFAISGATALIGLALALPIAMILRKMPGKIQQFVLVCSNIGANFTGFPLAFSFVILMGVSGSITLLLAQAGLLKDFNIYSTTGLVIVYSYFQILLGILLIFPGLSAITAEIEEAAYLMGTSRLAFWGQIGLPILAPSLLGAFLLLFANAMGTYATAWALVGGSANLVTIRIGELTAGDVFSDPNMADALAMLLVISLIVPILVEQFLITPRRIDA